MTHSPHAALRPVSVSAVQLRDAFWEPRRKINCEVTIPAQWKHCESTGRIQNFRVASGKVEGAFQGMFFNDSDVYKWAEAAAWSLATDPDPNLEATLDGVIAEIATAQQPDGYLNTYFMFEREKDRYANLKDMHEIYCAGHLIQAAVAHHRATGKTTFLEIATRLADHLCAIFGPGKRVGACGHEEAEMALVELYRDTGEPRYLALAECMIEARGQMPPILGGSNYHQDHLPFAQQKEVTGHAVRMLYLCSGATDVLAETGNKAYQAALSALWANFTGKRMYVTGGAGSRWEGEAFGADYELPNDRAYTETCAAIGSVMWQWRMLNLTGEARFADLMEWTLYNAVLPGLSLDGTHYFYQNPLSDTGKHRRQEWFGCACCPPNVARLLASLPGYFYSTSEDGIYVHLYASNRAIITLHTGETVVLSIQTEYPWNGRIDFTIEEAPAMPFALSFRRPGWASFRESDAGFLSGQYERIYKTWKAGESGSLEFPMQVDRIVTHPHVASNYRQQALKYGPLIYCLEQADHPDRDLHRIALHSYTEFTPEFRPDLLGGVTVLNGRGGITLSQPNSLYFAPGATTEAGAPVPIQAIPYYAWANRAPGPMRVWLPTI
jgi:DUF1680 family protein